MVSNKKRKPVFLKRKWNHVVFSRATILSFHPVEDSYRSWDLDTTGQLVDGLQQKQKRKPVFIKLKWNHVVFSRATILSFHPVDFVILMCICVNMNRYEYINECMYVLASIYVCVWL